ncbi:MAG: hypothetical protein P0Y56_06790 [Candidatus Andeanibacterium colombiense]|uniref:Lipoprotein n=1 Tax=Candidatus Andeanibacterium colombiense TaxID=3121345 RepID=A0AAJ5X8V6_9SPHN|nr:MAG: hypothetical protein P0Y56_06790 [Sphingomonadaceae bacterium]
MIRRFAAVSGVLALSACGGSQQASVAPSEAAVLASSPTPSATSTRELQIPAALRGRWGLVPADCTSTMGDNKGLIVVDAESIKFYEARAVLDVVKDVRESRVVASFSFSGEGQEWKLDEELHLEKDGRELIRTEHGENAMTEPLRYTRCA